MDGLHPDSRQSSQKRAIRGGFLALLVCAVVICVWTTFSDSPDQKGVTRGQFNDVLKLHARSLLEKPDEPAEATAATDKRIDDAIERVHSLIASHVSQDAAESLKNAKIGPDTWSDLSMVHRAMTDKRVQHVGFVVLEEVKKNMLANPIDIGNKIKERLDKNELRTLAQEVVPSRVRESLRRKWAGAKESDEASIWRAMLDPEGTSFAKLRANDTDTKAVTMQQPRQLRTGPWSAPTSINGWELAEGIVMIVMVSAAELVLHIDLLIPNVDMPLFVHAILMIPSYALGVGSCVIGMTVWCDLFLGALGVNVLDAILASMEWLPSPTLR